MKIILNSNELLNSVAELGVIAVKESVITITSFKKKFYKDGNDYVRYVVSMAAFDGRTQVASNVFAESADFDGDRIGTSVGLEFISVVNALARGGSGIITIEINSSNVVVSSGASSVTLPKKTEGMAPIVFDLSDKTTIEAIYEVPRLALKSAVDKVVASVDSDSDDTCPGICFIPDDKELKICALNRIIMTQTSCAVMKFNLPVDENGAAKGEHKVFATLSKVLKAMLASAEGEAVKVYKTMSHVIVQSNMQVCQLPLLATHITKTFVDALINISRPAGITVGKSALLNAIGVTQASNSEDKKVCLSSDKGQVIVANTNKTASTTIAPKDMEGDIIEMCFNGRLLRTVLTSVKTDEVIIRFGEPKKAVAIMEKDGDSAITALAPIDPNAAADKADKQN